MAGLLALIVPSAALAETYGSISGTVSEASGGKPIAGIRVCAISTSLSLLNEAESEHAFGCAKTESSGTYTIAELRAETYDVRFAKPAASELNFVPQWFEGKLLESEAMPVTVTTGATTGKIDAKLEPGAEIGGRITVASTGTPIEHAIALAVRPLAEGRYEAESFALGNANGEYVIRGVPSGPAIVAFLAPGYQAQVYNGRSTITEATVLSVTAPLLTSGIDAALVPAPAEGIEVGGEGSPGGGAGTGSLPGSGGGSKQGTPEGTLSLLRKHIAVRASGRAVVQIACSGSSPCRAKLTLRARRRARVKGHEKVISVEIGTSTVLSIGASHKLEVSISLNALGRRLLRKAGGVLHAELTLVTAGHRQVQRVVLRAHG